MERSFGGDVALLKALVEAMAKAERIGDALQEVSDVLGLGEAMDLETASLTVERLRLSRHEAEAALRHVQELADKAVDAVAARRSPGEPPATGVISRVQRKKTGEN